MLSVYTKKVVRLVMLLGLACGSAAAAFAATPAEKNAPQDAIKAGKTPEVSRELAMLPLPEYRINPPDVISLEMLKMVPLQPYRLEIYDVLEIRVAAALPEQPINDFFLVEGEGEVNLGPAYGKVKVAGMTVEEARLAILKSLEKFITKPDVSTQLSKASGAQQVSGEYAVAPDGRINLRQYGLVAISGKTIPEAQKTIEKHLEKYFTAPQVSLDVKAFNSQVYYVIADGAGLGDSIKRLSISGNETVLDAVAAIGGLSQVSSKKMWIARPSANNAEKGAVLPIDYAAITQRGATATNYQIQPGDRLYIEGDKTIAATNQLGKKTAPIERALGLLALETNTFDARRNSTQSASGGEAGKQPPKKDTKMDKIEADLTDALYRLLQELAPLPDNQ
jgi:polysaccharide export outer membrane protein